MPLPTVSVLDFIVDDNQFEIKAAVTNVTAIKRTLATKGEIPFFIVLNYIFFVNKI